MDRSKNSLAVKDAKNGEMINDQATREIAQIMRTTQDSITDVLAAAKRDHDEQMKSVMDAIKACEAEYEWDNTTQFIFESGKVIINMNNKGRIAKDRP